MFWRKNIPPDRNWRDELAASQRILRAFGEAHKAGVLSMGPRVHIAHGVLYLDILSNEEVPHTFELSYEAVVKIEEQLRDLCEKARKEKDRGRTDAA